MRSEAKAAAKGQQLVYELKITLLDVQPPVWRRIQVPDESLDKLHEHIQTAMGWTNSHLHRFQIDDVRYGDPEPLDDGWEDDEFVDSTKTRLSVLFEGRRKGICFFYEYDFGDGWRHGIQYESSHPLDPRQKYPRCIAGARACPPEDVGGPWGYADFLAAIGDPKHENHDNLLEWIGGTFDHEKFSAAEATNAMHCGLPDWPR